MTVQQRFVRLGEPYAAGFYEQPEAAPFQRFARGLRRFLEQREMPVYGGEPLYPCGRIMTGNFVQPDVPYTVKVSWEQLRQADAVAAEEIAKDIIEFKWELPSDFFESYMWTHSFPNYKRIEAEGLDSYEARIRKMHDTVLREGLLDVMAGIRTFHCRSLALLKAQSAPAELIAALEKVPFSPAESLYEALVCRNFMFYMDLCDDLGRLDADLFSYYKGEDMTEVLRCFFQNADVNEGWSGGLGPEYNALTVQCLHAVKGMRRPNLQLRVTPEMPDEVWQAATEAVIGGGGCPSFYNEAAFQSVLEKAYPGSTPEDRMRYCGAGCTEIMLEGLSNVGSVDGKLNLAKIFRAVMCESLPTAKSFEEFYASLLARCTEQANLMMDAIDYKQELRSRICPNPMRTLLIDDCIEKELDFNNRGARYNGSISILWGLVNVVDSLMVVKYLVFNEGMDGAELIRRLDSGERFLDRKDIPRHGQDVEEVNEMAHRFSADICDVFARRTPWSGGTFMPASIIFDTYERAGRTVGATPDGRQAGEPLADSLGGIHGNDNLGATAMLRSAASFSQKQLVGCPVLNVKLNAAQTRKSLRALVGGYFALGGMQLQVTCVNQEDLLAARENPEQYPNLIIRLGGYSEYFTRLTPVLQQTIIDRTMMEQM